MNAKEIAQICVLIKFKARKNITAPSWVKHGGKFDAVQSECLAWNRSFPHDYAKGKDEQMAKLYFNYSTMNAGKSTALLQASYNYRERGMETYLLTAKLDDRAGEGKVGSRIGIEQDADMFDEKTDLFAMIDKRRKSTTLACVFIDDCLLYTSPSPRDA